MRIDCHAHYFPGPYLDLIEAIGHGEVETKMGRRGAYRTHAEDAAPRIEAMDRAGVELQILSIATAGPYVQSEIGATIAALIFRAVPREAEHVCLLVAVGLAVAGGLASLSRLGARGAPA